MKGNTPLRETRALHPSQGHPAVPLSLPPGTAAALHGRRFLAGADAPKTRTTLLVTAESRLRLPASDRTPAFSEAARGPVYKGRGAALHHPAALCARAEPLLSPCHRISFFAKRGGETPRRVLVFAIVAGNPTACQEVFSGRAARRATAQKRAAVPPRPSGQGSCWVSASIWATSSLGAHPQRVGDLPDRFKIRLLLPIFDHGQMGAGNSRKAAQNIL